MDEIKQHKLYNVRYKNKEYRKQKKYPIYKLMVMTVMMIMTMMIKETIGNQDTNSANGSQTGSTLEISMKLK
jgi:hypothetical protein